MNTIDRLSRRAWHNHVARLLGSASLTLALAAPALAQETTTGSSETAQSTLDTIVVTGTRIARPDLEATSPINVLTSDDIALKSGSNIENLLNQTPQLTPSANAATNNGTDGGIATVNLRDLGTARTLVLVNGRRMVASNTAAEVDLNNIPSSLIERIDVVTGGASAVYGSDAIAGVVNFVMKQNFEGVETGGQYSITSRGDAATYNADVTLGGNFADGRGNAVLFLGWSKREALKQGDRDFSSVALGDAGAEDGLVELGSSRIPGGVVLTNATLPDGTVGQAKFEDDGTPVAREGETYNFAPDNYWQTPQERYLMNGFGRYEINDSIEAYTELLYVNNRIDSQLAEDANDIPDDGDSLLVTIDNPLYNDALKTYLSSNFDTDGDGVAEVTNFRRRMTENGPRYNIFEHDVFRAVGGLRGELGNSGLKYDAYYSFARTNRTEYLLNYTSDARIQNAVLVEPDPDNPGEYRCIDATARSQGCVPIRIFGEGGISEEGADYISPDALVKRDTEQQILSASINGDAFDIGAGPTGFAVGVEYRKESANNNPDAIVQSGELGPGNDEQPTSGSFNVKEIYGEIRVPVLADKPGIRNLELEAALRFSDYSTVGSVWTYKAGGQWEPTEGLVVRGLYQRAVRAPNINELFGGQATGADDFDDPCAARNDPSAEVRAFCIASGVPASELDAFEGDSAGQATTTTFSNPDLQEEKSNTYTAGVVFAPRAGPAAGLTASVDYYKITVKDAIYELGAQTTSDLCFQSLDVGNEFCQSIERNSITGIVEQINASTRNIGGLRVEGIDWQVAYTLPIDRLGIGGPDTRVIIANAGNRALTNEYQPTAEADSTIDCNGYYGAGCTGLGDYSSPRIRHNTTLTYMNGPLTWRNQLRYIGKMRNKSEDTAVPEVSGRFYWDMSFRYQASDWLGLTFGIDNVLDRDPAVLADQGPDGNTDSGLYDVYGRRFFAGVRTNF